MKKLLSGMLAIVLALALIIPGRSVSAADYTGKTVILHTNDVHGEVAGYGYAVTLRDKYEAAGADVILVDAGDFSQGSIYVSVSKGYNGVSLMNEADYDIAAFGNHEFDYGYEALKSNLEDAEFEVLCSDILEGDKTIGEANLIYTTSKGLKVGFFAMDTPETQTKVNPGLISSLTFLTGDKFYAAAQAQVNELKANGADLVICISHLGVDAESEPYRSIDLYAKVSGIDFIIDGHSHTVMTKGPNGEPIQQTGTKFENIGVIVIDNATKKVESNELVATAGLKKDSDVEELSNAIIEEMDAVYGAKFAESEVELNGDKAPGNRDMETNLGDLITDAMVWQIMKDPSAVKVDADHVVGITNGGGIRAWIHAGDVTMADVNTVLPFGNTIALVYVSGAELLEALEASTYCTPGAVGGFPQVSGIEYTVDTDKEFKANAETYPGSTYYGPASINRVTINSVNGKAFSKDDTYAVITNNFCAAGGDTYYAFAAATDQFDTSVPMDEALMNYITEELGGTIGAKYAEPAGRITITGEGAGVPAEAPATTPELPKTGTVSVALCYALGSMLMAGGAFMTRKSRKED